MASALDAYRAAAHAEADACFDDRALETQRLRILQRIAQAGQPGRVLRFPASTRTAPHITTTVSRRWISVAAAAGLIIGIAAGQMLHIQPSADWQRQTGRNMTVGAARQPATGAGLALVPASVSPDEELLTAVELAVQSHGAAELRALEDLTFVYEPR
jgi:hypothetical protein